MIEFKLDKNKIKVVTSNLDEIREYFSVNDDTARFRFNTNRFI